MTVRFENIAPFHRWGDTFRGTIGGASGLRRLRLAGAICLSLSPVLSACQSTPAEVLDIAAPAAETVGSGAVGVAMLLPRSAAGDLGSRARDMRDGAALAVDELGGGKIRLTIHDVAAPGSSIADAVVRAADAGAKIIVGPVTTEAVAAVAAIPEQERPPVLSLATNAAAPKKQGVFAMASDEVDSALESARLMIALGKPDILVFVPETRKTQENRLQQGLEARGGKALGIIRYGASRASIDAAVADHRTQLAKAQTAIVLGDEAWPGEVVEAIRASDAVAADLVIVGTSAWPASLYADAAVDGAILAIADQESLKQISARYEERYGRPLSFAAAYGYDALATVSGIVRAMGADALTVKVLTASSGFRGATGVFRLRGDGSVERRFAVYRIVEGKLQPFQAAAEGF